MMNWTYISGFFDADGSLTFVRPNSGKMKTLQISFSNNELYILESIKHFIKKETGHNGFISIKKAKEESHSTNYELKYVFLNKCLDILQKIDSLHSKKQHRMKIAKKFQAVTPRNGKYTTEILEERRKLEDLFFRY